MPPKAPKEPFLLITIQDQIERGQNGESDTQRCYYMNPQSGLVEQVNDLGWILAKQRGITRLQALIQKRRDGGAQDTERIVEGVRGEIRKLVQNLSPEAQEAVVSQKPIPLVLLINSEGGSVTVMDNIMKIMREFHTRGAETFAYTTVRMMSAAAEIWGEARHRFVMRDTRALWHAGSVSGKGGKKRPLTEKERQTRKAELIHLFDSKVTDEAIKEVCTELLNDVANQGLKICMEGRDLKRAGLAEVAFSNFEELKTAFNAQTGWEGAGLEGAFDPVQVFWAASLADQQVQDQHGIGFLDGLPRPNRSPEFLEVLLKLADLSPKNPKK